MKNLIIEKLKSEILDYRDEVRKEKIGRVWEVGDGIARILGLSETMAGEMLEFETREGPIFGLAFNLEEDSVGAVVLGETEKIREGDVVKNTGKVLSVRVGEKLIGRTINPLGEPLDGRGPIFDLDDKEEFYPAERSAPNVMMRESVNTPLHTGIKAIDAMIPIGRGQRELIIGDRQLGKTAILIDTILHQLKDSYSTPVCIYVAVGQRESKVAKIADILKKTGSFSYSVIISASASSPASLWYTAPYVGCAIGEYFMDKGRDALVIYDDLTKHAWAYRQLSLLLRRPAGREAYPGDIFYLHSRLLERAAKLSKEYGGGSLTALPVVETQLGDISAYIPTNVISITDGQIYLEPDLFYQGIRPAVNVGLSVSRVGSAAQTKAMKKIAGSLRLELAQFRELQAFVQFASELDEQTRKRIERGKILTEILKQKEGETVPFEKQVCLVYAAVKGYLDNIPLSRISSFEKDFYSYLEIFHKADLLDILISKKELDEELEKILQKAIQDFIAHKT